MEHFTENRDTDLDRIDVSADDPKGAEHHERSEKNQARRSEGGEPLPQDHSFDRADGQAQCAERSALLLDRQGPRGHERHQERDGQMEPAERGPHDPDQGIDLLRLEVRGERCPGNLGVEVEREQEAMSDEQRGQSDD
ncbi:MAG: hypothetical protein IPK71_36440 [Myxococcales bacterium]|nr:hypothetical protein [Myxococcales bacterium]